MWYVTSWLLQEIWPGRPNYSKHTTHFPREMWLQKAACGEFPLGENLAGEMALTPESAFLKPGQEAEAVAMMR